MDGYAIVFTTASSQDEADKIASGLLDRRLVACVNIWGPVQSHFVWEGKRCVEKEHILMMKTRENLFSAVETAVRQLHSYQTPELIMLPVKDGSREYLLWLDQSVGDP